MNYEKHYNKLIENCRNRIEEPEYSENHHIVPRCQGGKDVDDNIVAMKPEEHFVAHQLLCKLYPTNHALAKAVAGMCRSSSKNPRTNKWYSWIRKRYSASVSGENNSSAKFTNTEVTDIYHSTVHMDTLAIQYGVTRHNIITIKRKVYYRCVTKDIQELPGHCEEDTGPGKNRPIPVDLIPDIFYDTGDYAHFLKKYGATANVVRNIKRKTSYKKITSGLKSPGQVKRYNLTYDMVNAVHDAAGTYAEIADRFDMHYNTVRNIKGRYSRVYNIWEDF